MNKNLWLKRIRNYAGFLGMILPWLSLIGALLVNFFNPLGAGFWKDFSISATYYVSPPLVGVLTAASIVLMCYDGYSIQDNLITTLSGVFGIMIVLFPCSCSIAPGTVGFFQLPVSISSKIHNASACVFFILLAVNDLFFFTRSVGNKTEMKELRNKVYIACGIGMIVSMLLMIIPIYFLAKTWLVEMLALSFFGVSWLTKGGAFKFLNDKE